MKRQREMGKKEQGAALFVSLILLLVLTIIGLSAANQSTLQERMAANVHARNVVMNGADSAVGAYMVAAYSSATINPGNVVYQTRIAGSYGPACVNETGTLGACGTRFLDNDRSKALQSQVTAELVAECGVCPGYSMGSTASVVKCNQYNVVGTGRLAGRTSTVTTTAFEVAACM